MPATYRIDTTRKLVLSSGSGTLTGEEMSDHQSRLKQDPEFRADLDQLMDFTDVEEITVSHEQLQRLAYDSPFGEGSRRAIVVQRPLFYGLARMFQTLTESQGPEVRIFEELAEAKRWLGLET